MTTATTRRGRWLRGGLVALIGLGALALPVANYTDHVADPWWGPESPAGDVALIALSAIVVACGVWLARKDWELEYLTTVVVWTYAITASVAVLFAWAIALQLWVVGEPEPYVLALDGVLIAALVAFTSGVITAKHQRDTDVVRRSEAEYRALAEEVIDCPTVATVVTDAENTIVWLNQAAAEFLRLDRETAMGSDRAAILERAFDGPVPPNEPNELCPGETETRVLRVPSGVDHDGRWLERCHQRIDEGLHAGGSIEQYIDVTERQEALEALESRERAVERLSNTISASPDTDDRVDQLLDTTRELLSVEYAAVLRPDSESEAEVVRSVGNGSAAGTAQPEAQVRCHTAVARTGSVQVDSRPFSAEVGGFRFDHAAAVTDGGNPAPSFETYLGAPIRVGAEQHGTLCFLGRERTTFDQWERTLADLVASLVGVELERERVGESGEQPTSRGDQAFDHEGERLEFVDRVVRHNVLNGLNLLNARTEQLEQAVGDDPEAADHLDVIRGRVEEMTEVVDSIRTFVDAVVERADHQHEPVPVGAQLVEAIEDAGATYDATFRAHDLPDPELRVEADDLLPAVFENVLSNAVQHNDADEPVVEVWTSVSSAETDTTAASGSQRTLTVHVADNGPGIPEETKRAMEGRGDVKLDDPGHGFGFYLVREMVESYGGEVRIRDNEPRGTVVDVSLPVEVVSDH